MYKRKVRIFTIICIMLILLFSSFSATYAQQLGSRMLKYGMSGEDVKQAQGMLKDLNYFFANTTGYYGNLTRNAIINFQKDNGLTPDGLLGPKTYACLKNTHKRYKDCTYLTYSDVLKYGHRSEQVRRLQAALKKLNYFSANTTGYYGWITQQSVINFQRDKGLYVDGIAGRNTINAINKAFVDSKKYYTVLPGDTLWKISVKYNTSTDQLMQYNNLKSTMIYPGQRLLISPSSGSSGDSSSGAKQPYITYQNYTVKSGDTAWSISIDKGIPMYELMKANNLNENSYLSVGQTIKIPVHHIPVKATVSSKHGEYLDWWTEAQYVWTIGKVAVVEDFYTGKTWKLKRTIGANHADVEPLTASDTAIMKQVWGGSWSWTMRPVLIHVDGRKIAASAAAMPHDVDNIKGNNFNGHMDVHFKNSTRHMDNSTDQRHQEAVKIAAGVK
ncbi:MAG: peptidoglycan-binding protein [Clostridia bacterium]|nr:peptidoglycan-binding protein [Clostridia bacterium]